MSLGSNAVMKRHEVAKPIHIQRLEAALDVRPFVNQVEKILQSDAGSESEDDDDLKSMNLRNEMSKGDKILHGVVTTKHERQSDRQRLFNLTSVGEERSWLRNVVLSSGTETDSEDDTPAGKEMRIKQMLKQRAFHNKYVKEYYKDSRKSRYMYYGAGLLSTIDRYPERRGGGGARGRGRGGRRGRGRGDAHHAQNQNQGVPIDWEEQLRNLKQEDDPPELVINTEKTGATRGRKKLSTLKTAEALTARRRRHWQLLVKKELGKVQRARTATHKELMLQRKRLATLCCKTWRHAAMQSQKNMKETVWRCKRLSREMQTYWRRYDRAERETRRRMEKEAEEQRKMDVELMEAKRQRRKLNFLITQTELYAHFMQKKMNDEEDIGADDILMHLDEDKDPRLVAVDHYDSEQMKEQAARNALEAVRIEKARTKQFDAAAGAEPIAERHSGDYDQPSIFRGTLKGYQLKGMNWLANLYDQGISGILADEMGLGKTVQCLAFLCHVAERLGVWGPFLVVSPASTLHNWQQEIEKFVPDFKVVPYWGSPAERRILRQFWERKDLHTEKAAFHVVVTSYQIVISDLKYLNRVSWQYMILDEAQAIKSSASMRWKLLLGFSCRNRLLLSGTPIQNSMAELWALLHFIMPTLFDSHEEFNEWFSKDIESHAENKSTIDEKHLSRLHMILKPFMLRRIKKDVENELSDKIEIMVHCPLTMRQKLLYMALKKKIKIEELLNLTISGDAGPNVDKSFTSNLMNLVMQFRKVCNHPELFERRDVKSPFSIRCDDYHMPKLIAEDCMLVRQIPSKRHILYNRLSVLTPEYVHRHSVDTGCFSFARFVDLSPAEVYGVMLCGWLVAIKHIQSTLDQYERLRHRQHWWYNYLKQTHVTETDTCDVTERARSKHRLLICQDGDVLKQRKGDSLMWSELLFTDPVCVYGGPFYSFLDHVIHYTPETIEHRAIRNKNSALAQTHDGSQGEILTEIKTEDGGTISVDTSIFPHVERPSYTREGQPTPVLEYLRFYSPKACAPPLSPFSSSRSFAYHQIRHEHCENSQGASLVKQLVDHTTPPNGWTSIQVPDKNQLVSDAGKLTVLDSLLRKLKERGHRVLIYSQMTKMIDLLEEYMWHRRHKYMRLDGSSKIAARRDMVADFQTRADIFVFLLSTRAGGLGINLTAADTVIFYDSDWNPTVDQQAMDRAHRLGQTKQVTVYRLICKGTIEERIMQRAREKSEIQRMVISGGNFKPDTLKPKEVVSLLLDDEEIELKYRQKSEEKKAEERKRKSGLLPPPSIIEPKRTRESVSEPGSPLNVEDDDNLVVDASPIPSPTSFSPVSGGTLNLWRGRRGRGAARRGRPPSHRHPRGERGGAHTPTTQPAVEPQECTSVTVSEGRSRPRGPGRPRSAAPRAPRPSRRPRRPQEPLLVPLAPPPTN